MKKYCILIISMFVLVFFASCSKGNDGDSINSPEEDTSSSPTDLLQLWDESLLVSIDGFRHVELDRDNEKYRLLEPFALEQIQEVIDDESKLLENINSGERASEPIEYEFIDSEIIGIYFTMEYLYRGDDDIRLYHSLYRLLPDDTSKIFIAGGRYLDDENWLRIGMDHLVASEKDGELVYLGRFSGDGTPESRGFREDLYDWLNDNFAD